MAALSETDLKLILGQNFRAEQEASNLSSGLGDSERVIRGQIAMLEGKKSVSFYFALLGVVLILASIFSVTGQTLLIQSGIGVAILVVGLAAYFYFYRKLGQVRSAALIADAAV
jgi:hypothetical protein